MTFPWLDDLVTRSHARLLDDPAAEPARDYLIARGVPEALWHTYRIGFAAPVLQATDAFIQQFKWGWCGRLIFPLTSVLGTAIGVQTAAIDLATPRHLRYRIFTAAPREVFPVAFGIREALPAIWRTREVVIVEGAFDLLALQPELPQVVAALTAKISATLQRFIERAADRAVSLLDQDATGQRGAHRLLGHATVVATPWYAGKDPGALTPAAKLALVRRLSYPVADDGTSSQGVGAVSAPGQRTGLGRARPV